MHPAPTSSATTRPRTWRARPATSSSRRDGNVFSGPELQLQGRALRGLLPRRRPTASRAPAPAARRSCIEFIDDQRAVATDATYSSCTIDDGNGEPVWILKARELRIDSETNEGIARDAVLRFYGVPILASPVLSFPLSDARKSGFLPPSFGIDSRSGFQAAIPYYWNIAPNRDATFTLPESVRRGAVARQRVPLPRAVVLRPGERQAAARTTASPIARAIRSAPITTARCRTTPCPAARAARLRRRLLEGLSARGARASTPRLLQTDLLVVAAVRRLVDLRAGDALAGAADRRPDDAHRRALRARAADRRALRRPWRGGLDVGFETEFNRFANPDDRYLGDAPDRDAHARARQRRPAVRLARLDADAEALVQRRDTIRSTCPLADGRRSASRVIPTFSVDSAWTLERETSFFGRAVRQTLEPRLLLRQHAVSATRRTCRTSTRRRRTSTSTRSSPRTRSPASTASPTRNQLTAGVISRVLDPDTGAEALRVGIAQRYLLPRPARHARRRAVDAALLRRARPRLDERWCRAGPSTPRCSSTPTTTASSARSLGVRYSPGPYPDRRRDLPAHARPDRAGRARLAVAGLRPGARAARGERRSGAARGCSGTLYGVGHVNYSTRDSRLTDSIVGFEYDAGCWIGRIVVERLSTGRSEATTRLLLQLELVGLSRLGSNPLQGLEGQCARLPAAARGAHDDHTVHPV